MLIGLLLRITEFLALFKGCFKGQSYAFFYSDCVSMILQAWKRDYTWQLQGC